MSNSNISGIGFVGTLQIVFITLKLLDIIKWPWIWVISPMWIPLVTVIFVILIIAIVAEIKFWIVEEK